MAIGPLFGSVSVLYWLVIWDWSVVSSFPSVFRLVATVWPAPITACSAPAPPWPVGVLPSAFQLCQNWVSELDRPLEPGSASAAWTWPSSVEAVLSPLVWVFCPRYWTSRNWSRIRPIDVMSTPNPSCEPAPVTLDRLWIVSGSRSVMLTDWREYPGVLALAMFWPVVSIAACAASSPLSAVCRPE